MSVRRALVGLSSIGLIFARLTLLWDQGEAALRVDSTSSSVVQHGPGDSSSRLRDVSTTDCGHVQQSRNGIFRNEAMVRVISSHLQSSRTAPRHPRTHAYAISWVSLHHEDCHLYFSLSSQRQSCPLVLSQNPGDCVLRL